MHRLFNQVYHVVLVYALRPRSWLWISLIGVMMILGLWSFESGNPIFGFYYGMWVAVFLNDQMTIQFAHYREVDAVVSNTAFSTAGGFLCHDDSPRARVCRLERRSFFVAMDGRHI